MSTTNFTSKYRCWNDCHPQGCPDHDATLELESVSDTLTFDNGKGSQISMQPPELESFLCMLNSFASTNSTIEDALKVAFAINDSAFYIVDKRDESKPIPGYYPQAVRDWLAKCSFEVRPDHVNFEAELIEDGSEGNLVKYKQGEHVTVTAWERVEIKARFRAVDGNWTRVEDEKND